jgi:spore coat polysaccharide biosynthesis protein SpsF
MGSARFPGKMLTPLGGRPLIEWVLTRLAGARRLDSTILATTDQTSDDVLAEVANRLGVDVFRGSEDDVLERFANAAAGAGARTVLRVCADNPFVDPGEVDQLVDAYLEADVDYACNHFDCFGSRYANGFGAEILDAILLADAADRFSEPRYREHVTLFCREHLGGYRLLAVPAPPDLAFPSLRFDVDRPADLAYLEHLVHCGVTVGTPAAHIVELARDLEAHAGLRHPSAH